MSNKLALTRAELQKPESLSEVFEIEAFRYNCVMNYQKTTGKSNGELIFEREKILFFKALAENKNLEKCNRFTVYAAMIELFASGSTLNDGNAYIIPYGERAVFQVGWKGRLEQMVQIPNIEFVNIPQIVYDGDEFDYELGENPKIIKHKRGKTKGEKTDIYLVIDLVGGGKKTFIMSREDVLAIRDQYSETYKSYIAACKAKNVEIGQPVKKLITPRGRDPFEITIDPPMWITSEEEAWRKTIVKRAYKWIPKTARMKALDERIKSNIDPEDGTIEEPVNIEYGIVDSDTPETTSSPEPVVIPVEQKTKKKKESPAKPEAPTNSAAPVDENPNIGEMLGNLGEAF